MLVESQMLSQAVEYKRKIAKIKGSIGQVNCSMVIWTHQDHM